MGSGPKAYPLSVQKGHQLVSELLDPNQDSLFDGIRGLTKEKQQLTLGFSDLSLWPVPLTVISGPPDGRCCVASWVVPTVECSVFGLLQPSHLRARIVSCLTQSPQGWVQGVACGGGGGLSVNVLEGCMDRWVDRWRMDRWGHS